MRGIVIAGTHSGCGKTTITLGILAALKKKGYNVQPFKTGPDFIDTGLHKLITGRTSRNLDLWMCGRDYVVDCFSKHSSDADISVVEGVMGLYDGNISTADLAAALGLPVILVVDAYGMAESAGAVVKGFFELRVKSLEFREMDSKLQTLNSKLSFAGVIFNRIASDKHYQRVRDSVADVPVLGYLPRDLDFEIPHRHLGLTVAEEAPISSEAIDRLADAVLRHIDMERIIQSTELRTSSTDNPPIPPLDKGGQGGVKIAVAYDKAFCFYYEDNFDLLRETGAEIVCFSPLSDSKIPDDADALYIGGGYPELHAERLSDNKPMLESIKKWSDEGKTIYAECGGFMYLTEGIYDFENVFHPMAGVFPFKTKIPPHPPLAKGGKGGFRAMLGYREVILNEDSVLGKKGTSIRGHEFHYSEIIKDSDELRVMSYELRNKKELLQIYSVNDGSGNYIFDEGYRVKNTLGSYIHIHFGSNHSAAENFINFCKGAPWK